MTTIEEVLSELLEMGKNNIDCPFCKEYRKIAMQSPENMEIAIRLGKDEFWRSQADKTYISRHPISIYCQPWVADKDATYIGSIKIPMSGISSWSDEDDPKFRIMHVFDVHGEMKPCTHMSDQKKPIPVGCAYESMPNRYVWI